MSPTVTLRARATAAAAGAAALIALSPGGAHADPLPLPAPPQPIESAVTARREHVVAVSPIVAGAALKGPADRLMRELGHASLDGQEV